MSRHRHEHPSAKAGRLEGAIDGLIGKLCGARSRFMEQRPRLPESEWTAFRDAYNAEMSAVAGVPRSSTRSAS